MVHLPRERVSLKVEGAGPVLRALRIREKMSIREVAAEMGWDRGLLGKYERGDLAVSSDVIYEFAVAIGLDPFFVHLQCLKGEYPGLNNSRSKAGRVIRALENSRVARAGRRRKPKT